MDDLNEGFGRNHIEVVIENVFVILMENLKRIRPKRENLADGHF